MDLSLDETTEAARESVRAVCARQTGFSAARDAEPLGHDPKLWTELCAIGLPGVAAPEEHGGGGAGLLAAVAAAQELGAILAPVPFAEHASASRLLAAVSPGYPVLARVVSGELIATLAPRARQGRAAAVPAGAVADVVVALDEGDLVAVQSAPPEQSLPNQANLAVADRDLHAGSRVVLATGAAATVAFDRAEAEWEILTGCWLNGLSQAALGVVTRWVMERYQFGVPIGSFQAVQHGLADLPARIDGGGLLGCEAAWCLEGGQRSETGASGRQLALMALQFAAETAAMVTSRLVQYHGGLGVAVEHDAQLFFRRARAVPLLAGARRQHLRKLGAELVQAGTG